MANKLSSYIPLIDFLSHTYGPDYEIALHNYSETESSAIYIINGHISGRTIGSPLSKRVSEAIKKGIHLKQDFIYDYASVFSNGKLLRSNTYFIKEDKKLIGLLCINFDDSRYRQVTKELLELCHPHNFIKQTYVYQDTFDNIPLDNTAEDFHVTSEEIIDEVLSKIATNFTISLTHLKLNEKLDIVAQLDENGVFNIKGAVKYVSEKLNCSQASLYRYLKQSKKKN